MTRKYPILEDSMNPVLSSLRSVQKRISELSEKMEESGVTGRYKLGYYTALCDVSLAISDEVLNKFAEQ